MKISFISFLLIITFIDISKQVTKFVSGDRDFYANYFLSSIEKVKVKSINYNVVCNEKYMMVNVTRASRRDDFIFNASFDARAIFTAVKFIGSIAIPRDSSDHNFQYELAKTSVDLCQFNKGIVTNILYQKLIELFFKQTYNGKAITCPTPIGVLHMTDCKVSAIQVPSLIPETKFQFTIKLIAKVAGVKGSVKLLDAVIRGEYIRP